jgi:hypothetical protein
MKLKLSSLKNERKRIEAGDFETYPFWQTPDGKKPIRFNVSGLSSQAYKRAAEDLAKELALKYKGDPIPEEIMHVKNGELFAEHILHEWDGLDEAYSPELALKLLTDRDYEALNEAVVWCARKRDSVTVEFVADTEKNLETPSVTS